MIKEILIKDKTISCNELTKFINLANTYQVDNICLPSYFLKYVNIEDLSVAALIDYPYGLSSMKTRVFEVVYSCSSGADIIDLTLNPFLVVNKRYEDIRTELRAVSRICKDKRKELRIILEYRMMEHHLLDICEIISLSGIDTVITSTGTMMDDPYDNILNTKIIMDNTPLQCILTGVSRTKEIFNLIKSEKIFGLRSPTKLIIEDIFGVISNEDRNIKG